MRGDAAAVLHQQPPYASPLSRAASLPDSKPRSTARLVDLSRRLYRTSWEESGVGALRRCFTKSGPALTRSKRHSQSLFAFLRDEKITERGALPPSQQTDFDAASKARRDFDKLQRLIVSSPSLPTANVVTSWSELPLDREALALAGPTRFTRLERSEAIDVLLGLLEQQGVPSGFAFDFLCQSHDFIDCIIEEAREQAGGIHQQRPQSSGQNISKREKLAAIVRHHGYDELIAYYEAIGSLAVDIPKLLQFSRQGVDDVRAKVEILCSYGLSKQDVAARLAEEPRLLLLSTAAVVVVPQFLQSLGLTSKQIAKMINCTIQSLDRSAREEMVIAVKKLEGLGVCHAEVKDLVTSFPGLLSQAGHRKLEPLTEYLVHIGLNHQQVGRALLRRPSLLAKDAEQLRPVGEYLEVAFASKDTVAKVVTQFPWIFNYDVQKDFRPTFKYLQSLGVPAGRIGYMFRRHPSLMRNRGNFEQKADFLMQLGLNGEGLAKVVSRAPQLLALSVEENLRPAVKFLNSLGLEGSDLVKVLQKRPQLLGFTERKLRANLAFLEELGLNDLEMRKLVNKGPVLLTLSLDNNLIPTRNFFYSKGFSRDDLATMLIRLPGLLGYKVSTVLEPKYEYITRIMERSLEEIVKFPQIFSYSLSCRIKPRQVQIGSLGIRRSLTRVYSCSDEEFDRRLQGWRVPHDLIRYEGDGNGRYNLQSPIAMELNKPADANVKTGERPARPGRSGGCGGVVAPRRGRIRRLRSAEQAPPSSRERQRGQRQAQAEQEGAVEAMTATTGQPPPLRLFNTMTRQKEAFAPRVAGQVSMYVCGVTVYDYSHIGHARVYVTFDVLYRYLRHLKYNVNYVRNVTDVDDKILKRASELGESPTELSDRFFHEFKADMEALGCLSPTVEPCVTTHIGPIISMIQQIVEKGHGYAVGGDVFFSVDSLPDYGALSGRRPEENRAGTRVAVDERKHNPADFALWKIAKHGELSWQSPWGPGRPGWHIECSAMSAEYLGPQMDIHGGGSDLIFPHHENELAQNKAVCCESHIGYWLHNGFVTVDAVKMSKSLGNFFTIRKVLEEYHPLALRLFLLGTQYRSPMNYSQQSLEAASDRCFYLYQTLADCNAISEVAQDGSLAASKLAEDEALKLTDSFAAAMTDDLHTPLAIAATVEPLKLMNDLMHTKQGRKDKTRRASLILLQQSVETALDILGLSVASYVNVVEELKELALKRRGLTREVLAAHMAKRAAARANKDYKKADAIRMELAALGVMLMDGGDGMLWRPAALDGDSITGKSTL
eukprot:SM000011S19136  [mRNA]  locus=s11:996366:1007475:- [translate_table: standard]